MTNETTTPTPALNAPAKAAIREAIARTFTTAHPSADAAVTSATTAVIEIVEPLIEIKLDDAGQSTRVALKSLDQTLNRKLDGDDIIADVKAWWVAQYDGGDRSPELIQLGDILADHRTYTEQEIELDESGRAKARDEIDSYITDTING